MSLWWMSLLAGPLWAQGPPVLPAVPRNFGVEVRKISAGERYALGGREVSRRQAFEALGAEPGRVPDDAGRLRVVVIGPAEVRRPAVEALKADPALGPWRGRLVVQDYDP